MVCSLVSKHFGNPQRVEGYQNVLKLSCTPFVFTSHKAFLENKKRSGTSIPALFFA